MCKKQNKICTGIENLLIQKNFHQLSKKEKSTLKRHFSTCESCRNFTETINGFYTLLSIPQNNEIKPDPEIREKSILRMKEISPSPEGLVITLKQLFSDFLNLKIHVYQAALGIVVLFLSFYTINKFFTPEHGFNFHQIKPSEYHRKIDFQTNTLEQIDMVRKQKIGRNVMEDSLLVKMFNTVF